MSNRTRQPRRSPLPIGRVRAAARAAVEAVEPRVLFATYTVTSVDDAGPGTLRQAILDANASAGADAIHFDIAGTGVRTIVPATALPALGDGITIDGTTQPGYAGAPVVELIGPVLGPAKLIDAGLRVTGDGNVIRGLAVERFLASVWVDGDDNVVAGSVIGLDAAGTNLTAGFTATGVYVRGDRNTVGGTGPGDRNVVSGNTAIGVLNTGVGTRVLGNFIGTDATGTAARPNGIGVSPAGGEMTIGGTLAAARNVISGNGTAIGMYSGSAGGTATQVLGNYIGTDVTGLAALSNARGIELDTGTATIGGTAPGAGNVISGNGYGLQLFGDQTAGFVVQGNAIGVAADGSPLGNTTAGVISYGWSQAVTTIGGVAAGAANTIAHNGIGVVLYDGGGPAATTGGTFVRGNAIRDNAGLGIDLGGDGVTANEPGDAATVPNGGQNAPFVDAVTNAAGLATAEVSLTAEPNATYTIDLYSVATPDPSGRGEGDEYLASATVTTDAAGNASASVPLGAVPAGRYVTATATGTRGTGEFSNAVGVGQVAPPQLPRPAAPQLTADSDTGLSATDGVTNDPTPTFVGTAAPNATVKLFTWRGEIGSAQTGPDGAYTVTAVAPPDAAVRAIVYGVPGQSSDPSPPAFVTYDATPPSALLHVPNRANEYVRPTYATVSFNSPVYGFDVTKATLTRDGGPNLLTPAQTVDAGTVPYNSVTIRNLDQVAFATGTYTLSLAAGAAFDVAGNPSTAPTSVTFSLNGTTTVSVVATDPAADEAGDTGTFVLARDGSADAPLTVQLSFGGGLGGAQEGWDFTLAGPGYTNHYLTFAAGQSTATLTVTPKADAVFDPQETVRLSVVAAPGVQGVPGGAATVTIADRTPFTGTILPPPYETAEPVPYIRGTFDRTANGFGASDLKLTRDGGPDLLAGSGATLTMYDNGTYWQLTGLNDLTADPGDYELTLAAAGSGIVDAYGTPLAGDAVASWTRLGSPVLTALSPAAGTTTSSTVDEVVVRLDRPFDLFFPTVRLTTPRGETYNVYETLKKTTPDGGTTWRLSGFGGLTEAIGDYRAEVRASAHDGYGTWLVVPDAVTWTRTPQPNTSITISPNADAHVRDGSYAGQRFGQATALEVRKSGTPGNRREAFVVFRMADYGKPEFITSAKVRLYGKLSAAGSVPVAIYPVGASFGEASTDAPTWNARPATSATALATRTVTNTAGDVRYDWDVTAYLKQRMAAGDNYVAFALKATAATTPLVTFRSRNATAGKPELNVLLSPPATPPPQAIVVSASAATVAEGKTASATVKLAARPTADVTVTVARTAGDADLSAGPLTLTFTPANWSTAQLVTLAAAQDADAANGSATFTISSSGLASKSLVATEADDDAAVTKTLRASADAYVRDGTYAGANYGSAASVFVRKTSTAGASRQTVLKFDLAGVSSVSSAVLRLYGKVESTAAASVAVQAFAAANTSWTESGVTWKNRPATTGSSLGQATVAGTTAKWYQIDLTAWLKAQKAAGKTTVALVLTSPTATAAAAVFNADEATGSRPELVVKG